MASLDCSGTSPQKGEIVLQKLFEGANFLCGSRHKHNIVKSVRPETIKRDTAVRSLQAFIKVFYGRSVRRGERERDTENPFYPVIELRLLLHAMHKSQVTEDPKDCVAKGDLQAD